MGRFGDTIGALYPAPRVATNVAMRNEKMHAAASIWNNMSTDERREYIDKIYPTNTMGYLKRVSETPFDQLDRGIKDMVAGRLIYNGVRGYYDPQIQ